MLSLLLAGGLVLPAAQLAIAQQSRPSNPGAAPGARPANDLPGRFDANAAAAGQMHANSVLRGSQIIGATVDLRGGTRLGAIQDFVLGDGGCVEYVVAAYGNQFVPIPWAAAMYQPDQRVLMVDIDPGRIHEMPMYRQFSELTNQQFSDRVHTFYRGVSSQTGDLHRGAEHQERGATNSQPMTRGEHPAQGTAEKGTAGKGTAGKGAPAKGAPARPGRSERP
jgi:PRC-barrel domain